MPPQDRLICEIENQIPEIAGLAAEVEAFGERNRLPEVAVSHLNLALDELLTNTISYGYGPGVRDRIRVSLRIEGDDLIAELTDHGRPFDPFSQPIPDTTQSIEDRPIGGLGIFLVGKLMDQVDYQRRDGQNCVRLVKKLKLARK